MSATASDAIAAAELPSLFDELLGRGPFALAVSGGADSMALLYLFSMWWHGYLVPSDAAVAAVTPIILTVDHGLRLQSAAEAAIVKTHADQLGFTHQTLTWDGPKPTTGLQAAARHARYALLTEGCRNSRPMRSLLVAHHQDDQAETFLMRLARGSGVEGLAAMRPQTIFDGVRVLRPLLGVPKARLLATLAAHAIPWCEDTSNSDPKFERVRWRSAMAELNRHGLTADALTRTARRMERASSALDAVTETAMAASHADHHGGAFTSLDFGVFAEAHAELRIRILQRVLARHGGTSPSAQLSEIEDMVQDMEQRHHGAATLGGVLMRWARRRNSFVAFREPARAAAASLSLQPGQSMDWDGRFTVSVPNCERVRQMCQSGPVTVRAMTATDYATCMAAFEPAEVPKQGLAKKSVLNTALTSEIATTLPAFHVSGTLIAVPYFTDQWCQQNRAKPLPGHDLCSAVWLQRGV
jgi:tRNA(Ile)-lysidine synthase